MKDAARRAIQMLLRCNCRYAGRIDGEIGPVSTAGVDDLLSGCDYLLREGHRRWGHLKRAVAAAQITLTHQGFPAEVTGEWDAATELAFQKWHHLHTTGERLH